MAARRAFSDLTSCAGDAFDVSVGYGLENYLDDGVQLDAGFALVTACDDGNLCNGVESCESSEGCLLGAPPTVDDGFACTVDYCDEADGVVHADGGTCEFDAGLDFSTGRNPNDVWSYGYSDVPGGEFVPYDAATLGPAGIVLWHEPSIAYWLSAIHNPTGDPVSPSGGMVLQPGEFVLHPSPSNDNSVLRWTAPLAGTYEVAIDMTLIDTDAKTADVHVYDGDVQILGELLSGAGDTVAYFDVVTVCANETLSVSVGYGLENYFDDGVAVDAVISLIDDDNDCT